MTMVHRQRVDDHGIRAFHRNGKLSMDAIKAPGKKPK
jgi:hypothetical protein